MNCAAAQNEAGAVIEARGAENMARLRDGVAAKEETSRREKAPTPSANQHGEKS